ncbi:MAG: CBS domain-containing protein [Polyangiales bacterium]
MKTAPRTVREIMSDTLVVLGEDETLTDLAENMERFSLRHLPVVAGDRLVGLITHRDVLRAAVLGGQRRADDPPLRVREIMSRDVITVSPSLHLTLAADMLIERKVGCLLVVDEGGALVGIVTENDFLKLARTLLAS